MSGEVLPKEALLRFVVKPDGGLVADLEGSLPGRGMWVRPNLLEQAIKRSLFNRAHGGHVSVPEGFLDTLEGLLRVRTMNFLGLARRAGQVITGFDQVRNVLLTGRCGALVAARDGAPDGRNKIRRVATGAAVVELFKGAELSAAIGKENVVHVFVTSGKFSRQITRYAGIISCLRQPDVAQLNTDLNAAV